MSKEESRQRRRQLDHDRYMSHREERLKKQRTYYKQHREEILRKKRMGLIR